MPSIVSRPTVSRTTTRGLSEADTQEYIDLILSAEEGQMVEVDDSERDSREKAYVRGERVRVAALKYKIMPKGKTIGIVAFKDESASTEDAEVWKAGVYLKDAPKPSAKKDEKKDTKDAAKDEKAAAKA